MDPNQKRDTWWLYHGNFILADYEEALCILGDGRVPNKAEEVISYIHNCLNDLETDGRGSHEDKPTVLGLLPPSKVLMA